MGKSLRSCLVLVVTPAALLGLALLVGAEHGRLIPHAAAQTHAANPRLAKAYKFQRDGWTFVHLEGSPADIGFQNGALLSKEIADAFNAIKFQDTHRTKRDWNFFHDTAKNVYWSHIDPEYQQELQGIADGLKSKGVNMDVYDVIAYNAFEELPDYYLPWLEAKQKKQGMLIPAHDKLAAPESCSAFVATGSYTKDGKPVIAHNNWTSVIPGARWRIMYDIVPAKGYRMIMDGMPGVIVSDDDFTINSGGLAVTETTITGFHGYDPNGKPEFVRARKATQYANSVDSYVKIMQDGNNGGYANDWLIADANTGEVARFEQGLEHTRLWRTKDGYFEGSNFASDPQLIKDETDFDPEKKGTSPNARRERWHELMAQYKGKIDVAAAQKFESDHYDTFEKKEDPDERTLCGHVEVSPRGIPEWGWGPYHPGGTVQAKAADATMIKSMSLTARVGHACGTNFNAAEFLKKHPEYGWQKPVLTDMNSAPWATFKSGERQ
ncbi:MAG: C45 family autoproteolytic acyltransferase/hydrolase [Terriglobales bacterium]